MENQSGKMTKMIENDSMQGSGTHSVYYRLVTLWVVSEGVAGGFAHGLHIPFSGIFLSGFAVICISLIGYYNHRNQSSGFISGGGILKATIIVCIFKMLLSPNSPPSAYFAVLFQGLAGAVLFYRQKRFRLSCILLGFLALSESAVQKILVLVILYGVDFWKAVNDFIKKVTHAEVVTNYALWLAILYIFIHGVIGILIGLWAARMISKATTWRRSSNEFTLSLDDTEVNSNRRPHSHKRRRFINVFVILAWTFILLLFLQPYLHMGDPVLSRSKAMMIALRSLFILLSWYILISPVISFLIKKRLKKQQRKSGREIDQVFSLLPSTKNMFKQSWKLSSSSKGFPRIELFWKVLLMNILFENNDINNTGSSLAKQNDGLR